MKKLLSLILACMMILLALSGCASTAAGTSAKTKVGLAMPTKEQPTPSRQMALPAKRRKKQKPRQ